MKTSNLRENIAETREKMDGTIEELGHRLNPRHLTHELGSWWDRSLNRDTLEEIKDRGADVVEHIGRHPVPYALVGLGLGLGAYAVFKDHSRNRSQMERIQERAEEAVETAREASGKAAHSLREASGKATESVREGYHRAVAASGEATQKARFALQDAGESFQQAADEQPLAVGAGLAAAGLILGLLLPHSKTEDRLVGEQSKTLKRQAQEKGRTILQRGREALHETVEDAQKRAREAGLAPEGSGKGDGNSRPTRKKTTSRKRKAPARA